MKIFVVVLALIVGWAVFYFDDISDFSSSMHLNQQQASELIKAGDECVEISEKATAHIIPTLEFQRLELAGRKANVVVRCMADHDFYQNPAWLKYAQPIAAKASSDQHISIEEALENLKRSDMLIFEPGQNKTIYWQYIKSPPT